MREFTRHLRIHFFTVLVTMVIFLIVRYGLLKSYGMVPLEQVYLQHSYSAMFYIVTISVSGLVIASALAGIDTLIIRPLIRSKSFITVLFTSVAINLVILGVIIFGIDRFINMFLEGLANQPIVQTDNWEFLVSAFVLLIAITISRIVIEIDRKLGPGRLWEFVTGKFFTPREEERIFMFIDLKGSTMIAERIGHYQFSELLQDCFRDLSVVDRFHAEVYQYVGDEVVLSWEVSRSESFEEFLSAFFAFEDRILARSDYYNEKYGLVPRFKAGVHAGPAIITEVGELKREITYHGDTLNTAARIQEQCNALDARLLVSDSLYDIVKSYSPYQFEDVGFIKLKGKEADVRLFKVSA